MALMLWRESLQGTQLGHNGNLKESVWMLMCHFSSSLALDLNSTTMRGSQACPKLTAIIRYYISVPVMFTVNLLCAMWHQCVRTLDVQVPPHAKALFRC
jgi:hypothetical protein